LRKSPERESSRLDGDKQLEEVFCKASIGKQKDQLAVHLDQMHEYRKEESLHARKKDFSIDL